MIGSTMLHTWQYLLAVNAALLPSARPLSAHNTASGAGGHLRRISGRAGLRRGGLGLRLGLAASWRGVCSGLRCLSSRRGSSVCRGRRAARLGRGLGGLDDALANEVAAVEHLPAPVQPALGLHSRACELVVLCISMQPVHVNKQIAGISGGSTRAEDPVCKGSAC